MEELVTLGGGGMGGGGAEACRPAFLDSTTTEKLYVIQRAN